MSDGVRALDVLRADFTGFERVLDKVGTGELESFHSLSGQYNMFDDVDGLKARLGVLAAEIRQQLADLGDTGEESAVWAVSRRVEMLDNLLEQLSRYVTVADMRGAALTSGDLLQKLQGWIKTLRDWLAGIRKQLSAIAGEA
ncbi:MAG: hypothetical protein ACRC1J_12600 [Sandaracinobacteroides sp.]